MLILASQSPTRRTLLSQAGVVFSAEPAGIDECALESGAVDNGAGPRDLATLLARAKAQAVAGRLPDAVVIGADQTLALGDALLHKPRDLADAKSQLQLLGGKTHRLHVGVSLVRNDVLLWEHLSTAEMTMRAFQPAECDAILALEGDKILHSVGGYRLEGPSIRLFEAVVGDYFTVLGLPLLPLLAALREHCPSSLPGSAP